MKRKRHYISLGWVVVAVLMSIAIHAFSHKEGRQEEESQEVTTTQQQSEGSWTTMPDSVVEMCMAAPLKTVPEQVVRRTAYVASYNKRTRCPNWVAWLLTAEHTDGEVFSQMRVCHLWEGAGKIRFGIYACSPEDSSFTARFTDLAVTDCAWKAHDGQQPDEA